MIPHSAPALTFLALCLVAGVSAADTDTNTENNTDSDTDLVADEDQKIYLEEDGLVLFEVEGSDPAEGWELKTELSGFRSSGYFEWAGPNRFNKNQAGQGIVKYYIRIETAGNYQMRWRNQIAVGDSNTEHNDSWIRLATGADVADEHPLDGWTKVYSNTLGVWNWNSLTVDHVGEPIRQYFSQGDHTVEISGRSQGHAIDQIALYRYDDVPYSPQRANNWDLSPYVAFDGTIITPDPAEPEEEELSETSAGINLNLAPENWQDLQSQTCVANTLAISSTDVATFDPSNSGSGYARGEFATINNSLSTMLLSFDTSLVPPVTSAVLEYSTGDEVSDGEITYVLGSHNDWQIGTEEINSPPEFLLELGRASGGWATDSRYQSSLPADALAQGFNTIIVGSATESAPLMIHAQPSSDLAPRLLLTGDEDFCAIWQANFDAANVPIEPPDEINEPVDETEEPAEEVEEPTDVEQESESEEETTPEVQPRDESERSSKSGGLIGGAMLWLIMGALGLSLINRHQQINSSSRRS